MAFLCRTSEKQYLNRKGGALALRLAFVLWLGGIKRSQQTFDSLGGTMSSANTEGNRSEVEIDRELRRSKPWRKDPHYFKHVQVSSLALLKMAMHTRAGEPLEVMGILQGRVAENTFVVTDVFALPVEGTETRVNAGASANEFMVEYISGSQSVSDGTAVVGWYHSHPGYGCWLSGIDVNTQLQQQRYQVSMLYYAWAFFLPDLSS